MQHANKKITISTLIRKIYNTPTISHDQCNSVVKQTTNFVNTFLYLLFESHTLWHTVLYNMINDNNRLIYKHEITLINSNN